MESIELLRKKLVQLRKSQNLTQKQLARLSNVSQSLISKFEEGLIIPRYDSLYKIYWTLVGLNKEREIKEFMKSKAIFLDVNDTVKKTKSLMKEYAFSQIPVKENGEIVGKVEVEDLIGLSDSELVKNVMTEPYDILSPETSVEIVKNILKSGKKAVLIKDKKEYYIITSADLI